MTGSGIVAAADGSFYGIGVAIVISLVGFLYTVYNGVRTDRQSASSSIEHAMNDRINDLIRQRDEARAEAAARDAQCKALERENIRLMREVFKLENGHDK